MSDGFKIPDLIIKKRDGKTLTEAEIEVLIQGVVSGTVQESQIGAILMAIYHQGLTVPEITSLTRAMTESGDTLTWPAEWKGVIVDKHSTGGVGDKISLVLAPALAACGMKVPMISGRGLGHTGGTLDKLESIPGFQVSVTSEKMQDILDTVGCCIVGQTKCLCPADRILYATRDVTGTVDQDGLITASIVSKKAAEKLDGLILDVKFGCGALKKTIDDARRLAELMVATANGVGMKTVALLTDMNSPLGHMIGNAHEVAESISCLHGDGPADLTDLTVQLGGHLLRVVGQASSTEEGSQKIKSSIQDGSALRKFCSMMKAQGVASETAEALCRSDTDLFTILPSAKHTVALLCPKDGYVTEINALTCADVAQNMGAGRFKAGDAIDHSVGLELLVALGDQVTKDSPWVKVSVNHDLHPELKVKLESAIVISDSPCESNNNRVKSVVA